MYDELGTDTSHVDCIIMGLVFMQNRPGFDAVVYLYLKLCLLNIIREEVCVWIFNFQSILVSLKEKVQHSGKYIYLLSLCRMLTWCKMSRKMGRSILMSC